jgi:hypothetical protein
LPAAPMPTGQSMAVIDPILDFHSALIFER